MFSFFRRQSKSKSKSKNKQSGSSIASDIQCIPVAKYEINCTAKKHQPLRVETETCKQSLPTSSSSFGAMGNSESVQTQSNNENSTASANECMKFNNNEYPNKVSDGFQWIPEKCYDDFQSKIDSDEFLKDADQFGTAPSSPVEENLVLNATSQLLLQQARDAFFKEVQESYSTDLIKSDEKSLEENAKDDTQKDPIAMKPPDNNNQTNTNNNTNSDNFQIMFNKASNQTGVDDIPFVDSEEDPETESDPVIKINTEETITSEESNVVSEVTKLDYEISTGPYANAAFEDEQFKEAEERKSNSISGTDYNGIAHCKPALIRIPNITITESSDSEGENEEFEDDYDNNRQNQFYIDPRYERTYPTILYDIKEVEEPFSDASDFDSGSFNDDKPRDSLHKNLRELKDPEKTLDKFSSSSYAKKKRTSRGSLKSKFTRHVVQNEFKHEDQINSLKCEIEGRNSENEELKGKISNLQYEIMNKTWGMDRLQADLASFQTEADSVRKKLLKVEDDLVKYKNKNTELNEQLLKSLERESNCKQLNELQNEVEKLKTTIHDLHIELEKTISEKQEIQKKIIDLEKGKHERIKTLEIALDETLKQKQKLQSRFDTEYEKLRTVNSDREQQLVDDFEWKLREVELNCKRKIEDKDRNSEEKIKQIRKQMENEILQLKEQCKQFEKYKSYEAEVTQLRGLIQEQDRSFRIAMRTAEQLQNNERMLNDEIEKLKNSLEKERTHLTTIQSIHSREIAEKDRKHSFKLEQQKSELNSQWEEKMRRETTRFKLDVEKQHKEEKRAILDESKLKTEQLLKVNDEMWEKKLRDSRNELEILEAKLTEKEESSRRELLKLQTNSDRDMLELRRRLDKLDLSYQEQLEKEQEQHELELDNLREEYEKKIQQNEQNWSQQILSTRATLELVKEQLQREAETQMAALNKKYMLQIEQQYDRLMKEKADAIADLREKHANELSELRNQLQEELQIQKSNESQILAQIHELKLELGDKDIDYCTLRQSHEQLISKLNALQEKISEYENFRRENETKLKNQQMEHASELTQMKDFYETEIKQWQMKFDTNINLLKEQIPESQKVEDNKGTQSQYQSKSARRKARARQRNQRSGHHHPQLTQQFSTSSV